MMPRCVSSPQGLGKLFLISTNDPSSQTRRPPSLAWPGPHSVAPPRPASSLPSVASQEHLPPFPAANTARGSWPPRLSAPSAEFLSILALAADPGTWARKAPCHPPASRCHTGHSALRCQLSRHEENWAAGLRTGCGTALLAKISRIVFHLILMSSVGTLAHKPAPENVQGIIAPLLRERGP